MKFDYKRYGKTLRPVMPYGIVGQKGFFDLFIVRFDLLKEEVELKPRP